jgi:hypothetical protein
LRKAGVRQDGTLSDVDGADPGLPYTDRDGIHEIYRSWRSLARLVRRAGADRRGVLSFARDRPGAAGLLCVVNLSAAPVELPAHGGVLLASGPLGTDRLPPDTAVWLRPSG